MVQHGQNGTTTGKTINLYYLLRRQRVRVHRDEPKGHSSLKASSLCCFLKYLSLHHRPLLFLHLKDTSIRDLIGLGVRVIFGLGRAPCTARTALWDQRDVAKRGRVSFQFRNYERLGTSIEHWFTISK
jgi:hypothetical protein